MIEPIVIVKVEDGMPIITNEYDNLDTAIIEWKIDTQRVEWFKLNGSINIVSDAYSQGDGIYLSKVNNEKLKQLIREYRLNKLL